MVDTDVSKLFSYLDEQFGEIKNEQKQIRHSVDVLTTTVDGYAKLGETYRQEILVMKYELDKHNEWFKLLEERFDLKFKN